MCAAVLHQCLHVYCLWLIGVTLIFNGTPQIIVQRCQIAAPRWPNDSSSATDKAIFKNRAQNIDIIETKCCQYPPLQFLEQKLVQHGSITIAIDCNGLSMLPSEEKWPNYASGPKFAPISESFWVRRLCNVCVWGFCAPNARILLGYIPPKWASSEKMICFTKIHNITIFVRRKDKTNYLSNQTWAKCYHSRNKH